jgi:hypothetical protein
MEVYSAFYLDFKGEWLGNKGGDQPKLFEIREKLDQRSKIKQNKEKITKTK